MKIILVISDGSAEAGHALEFALEIARKMEAGILLANTCKIHSKVIEKVMTAASPEKIFTAQFTEISKPAIETIDISEMDENRLAELVNKEQAWMIIKGIPDHLPANAAKEILNIHVVLNKVLCPLLLVPVGWTIKHIERLVYIADLRYCRIQIVKYLAGLAKPYRADLLIAHLSAKGLPNIEEKYALQLFNDQVSFNVRYEHLFFNNIKEQDLTTAVDVIINGMHNDIMVLLNHRFHFEEIIGRYLSPILPSHITIPLLIFPC